MIWKILHKEDIYIIFAGPLSNLLFLGYLLIGYVDTGLLFDFNNI
jgi:hypothetical protein